MAFFLKKFSLKEGNYEIYGKQLIVIIRAFKAWTAKLVSTDHPVRMVTDHSNLEYIISNKSQIRRQVYLSEFISCFNFKIVYQSGREGQKPKALEPRSENLEVRNRNDYNYHRILLKPHYLKEGIHGREYSKQLVPLGLLADSLHHQGRNSLGKHLQEAYDTHPWPTQGLFCFIH